MRTEEKTAVKNSIGRLIFALLSIIVQVAWIVIIVEWMNDYSAAISFCSSMAALIVAIRIYGMHTNAAFKMPWIILILTFPILGLCIFALFGHTNATKKMRDRFQDLDNRMFKCMTQDGQTMQKLEKENMGVANQLRYINNYAGYSFYQNTDVEFYKEASDGIEAQKEDLKKAEKFIFMEYHAIEQAISFQPIHAILAEKARQGVEVRIIYDDAGSIGFINKDFIKRMEADGIKCRVFNPIMPALNIFMNNRDHRKVTVIDGKVGFTGGYNLADEYFNITHPYQYWKDTGIRAEGDAVRNMTVMFLEMWNAIKEEDKNCSQYLPEISYKAKEEGYISVYADQPLDHENVGENVYMNMIKNAKHEIYFTTPYLIISDEMHRELSLAAKRGVDVRIVTPGVPDKKLIYKVTRSYYSRLVRSGVRIYEYTPGFLHAKQCVCDEETAVVGTINLDYRSLYLHFEDAAFLYRYKAIQDIYDDFENLFDVSKEVTNDYKTGRSPILRVSEVILRLVAPLM